MASSKYSAQFSDHVLSISDVRPSDVVRTTDRVRVAKDPGLAWELRRFRLGVGPPTSGMYETVCETVCKTWNCVHDGTLLTGSQGRSLVILWIWREGYRLARGNKSTNRTPNDHAKPNTQQEPLRDLMKIALTMCQVWYGWPSTRCWHRSKSYHLLLLQKQDCSYRK